MAYNVYLYGGLGMANPMNPVNIAIPVLLDVQRTLQGYFDQIVNTHDNAMGLRPAFGKAIVRWLADVPLIEKHELLVYFIPEGITVITNLKIEAGRPPPDSDPDGRTRIGTGGATGRPSGSEVYSTVRTSIDIANVMFHEFMHNKLGLDDTGLHSHGGLAAKQLPFNGRPTPRNINEMAAALGNPRPQWTDGILMCQSYILSGANRFPL